MATDVVVVRVFVDDADQHGSPLGVVFDGPRAREERQRMAVSLAYSETVFVDDAATPRRHTASCREMPVWMEGDFPERAGCTPGRGRTMQAH